MNARRWLDHIPLLRAMGIIVLALVGVGFALSSFQKADNTIWRLPMENWRWAPAASYDETRAPDAGWQPVIYGETVPTTQYWLRVSVPPHDWIDPHLMVQNVGSLKAYDGDKRLFSFLLDTKHVRIDPNFHWKMVPVPVPMPAYVDLLVRYKTPAPVTASVVIGNKSNIVSQIVHQDMDNLILGGLLLFSGFIALGLYASQRDSLYVYFALLVFFGGYAAIVRNLLLQILWDVPALTYFQNVCLPFATFAFVGALGKVFPDLLPRTILWLRRTMLVVSLLTAASSLVSVKFYMFSVIAFLPVFFIVSAVSYWTIWTAYRKYRDIESVWIMAGFSLLAAIALVHMYRFVIFPWMPYWFVEKTFWVHSLPQDMMFWGLFAFVVCLIRVIIYRYTGMTRELKEMARTLETAVRLRTKELRVRTEQLETAHERLAASMKENAEALAEAMILEERHRITGSIHDTVGHTLSATIIQLEAAKRLISKDIALAEEKLVSSQELARTGLEDIRQSVRLLREDASYYDLPGVIGALVRETVQAYGCKIDWDIGPLPVAMTTLQKRMIFQTLQECFGYALKESPTKSGFRIDLRSGDGGVRLLFTQYGQSVSSREYGISMRALIDRIARMGCRLTFVSEEPDRVLLLELPETGAANRVV